MKKKPLDVTRCKSCSTVSAVANVDEVTLRAKQPPQGVLGVKPRIEFFINGQKLNSAIKMDYSVADNGLAHVTLELICKLTVET